MRLVQRVPRWDPPSPSLQLLSAWFKLEGQRLEEGKNGHRTKQKYICQYFPKCDSFTSIFSEAAFPNTFQEFLHRFLAFWFASKPAAFQRDFFSLSRLKTTKKQNKPTSPVLPALMSDQSSQQWGLEAAGKPCVKINTDVIWRESGSWNLGQINVCWGN